MNSWLDAGVMRCRQCGRSFVSSDTARVRCCEWCKEQPQYEGRILKWSGDTSNDSSTE